MSKYQWSFGDYDDDTHFIEAQHSDMIQRLNVDAEDVLILRDMLDEVVEMEGYDHEEVFEEAGYDV